MPNRVLVVDDDPITCELIQEVLRSAEIEALALTDSSKAAARLKEEKFDAVFLDLRMPPPDGLELARQIRASGLNQHTPIAMITGDEDRAALTRAFQAGANFFLFKPVDRPRLLRLLRAAEAVMHRERRRFQRLQVSCKVLIESGQDRIRGTTLDLSLAGMLVQADRAFPAGSVVHVSLELKPGGAPVRGTARVVRVTQDGSMGLRLENIDAAESERLQEFLLPLILAEVSQKTPVAPYR
jgi:CheY-like chemotaxis protein